MIHDYSHADTMMTTPYIASIKRTTEGRPSEVRFTDGHIQRTVWDMAGNKLSTEYLVEADAIALGEGLSPAEPDLTATEGGISGIDTTGIAPIDPVTPVIHLYTREYTGDGHVIKAETSNTWTGTDTTRVIESIQFDGGYFDNGGGANYYVKDYLGNIIAVVDQGGHLVQATDYYPYGLPFRMPDMDEDNNATAETGDTGTGSTSNRYLFGGKEFLTEDGLNEYYQEARQYIPRIPRFDRIDDRCEDNREHTPYLAFAGNPISFIDPDGNYFTDVSKPYLNDFIEKTNEIIADIQSEIENLKKEGAKAKKLESLTKRKQKYLKVLDEISELKNSRTRYVIFKSSESFEGDGFKNQAYYDLNKGSFYIILSSDYKEYDIAHELKHANQFENGQYSTGTTPNGAPFYDLEDEKEAYERGRDYGGPYFNSLRNLYENIQHGDHRVKPEYSKEDLQKLSDDNSACFKANGELYTPKKKKQ